MKKPLVLAVLTAVLMTGCSGKSPADPAAAPAASSTSSATGIVVPHEVGKRLDKAHEELEDLGFRVKITDAIEGKSVFLKSNWEVISQDPLPDTAAAKASTVNLGVKRIVVTPTPTPTPTPPPTPTPAPTPPPPPPPTRTTPGGAGVGTGTGGGTGGDVNPPVPNPPIIGGGIICKDGYAWPGTTRQGACRGHGGIAN